MTRPSNRPDFRGVAVYRVFAFANRDAGSCVGNRIGCLGLFGVGHQHLRRGEEEIEGEFGHDDMVFLLQKTTQDPRVYR